MWVELEDGDYFMLDARCSIRLNPAEGTAQILLIDVGEFITVTKGDGVTLETVKKREEARKKHAQQRTQGRGAEAVALYEFLDGLAG